MKKVIIIIVSVLFVLALLAFAYIYFFMNRKPYYDSILKNIDKSFDVNNYYIFGTHLEIEGCYDKKLEGDSFLVLKNKEEEIIVKANFEVVEDKTCFYISKKLNEGIYLDDLKIGDYLLLIKNNEEYYTLENKTEYDDLTYYTITKNKSNNRIDFDFDEYEEKKFLEFRIKEDFLPDDVYDIYIDPGHGGKDPGATPKYDGKEYKESDLNLNVALLLKGELQDLGYKVKLSREEDIDLEPYGDEGRAVMPNKYRAKYSISLHFNSTINRLKFGGVEVYAPANIDLSLAKTFANSIADEVLYSKKGTNKIANGVYLDLFTEKEIENSKKDLEEDGLIPYDIKVGAPIMYMIREVGGLNTYAYIDGRNDYYGLNPYYNSNYTAEPYLIEMAYVNYADDMKKIVENPSTFSSAIANAIKKYLKV